MSQERHLVLLDAIRDEMEHAQELFLRYSQDIPQGADEVTQLSKQAVWMPIIHARAEKADVLVRSLLLDPALSEVKKLYEAKLEEVDGDLGHEFIIQVNGVEYSSLTIAGIVRDVIQLAEPILGIDRTPRSAVFLRSICERLGPFVNEMVKARWITAPAKESDVNRVMYPLIRNAFPDAAQDRTVRFVDALGKPYFPDTSVPSIRTAVELKFATSEASLVKAIDEAVVDIGVYGDANYSSMILLIYATDDAITQEAVDLLWTRRKARLGHSKFDWYVCLTRGPGARRNSAGKATSGPSAGKSGRSISRPA